MGLIFYRRHLSAPSDHFIHKKIEEIPTRASKQKFLLDWTINGPFVDSDNKSLYFRISDSKKKMSHFEYISEDDAFFDEKAVERAISRLIAKAMEFELSFGFANRLSGAESIGKDTKSDDIVVVDVSSQGMGDVPQRRLSHGRTGDVPEKAGGLILPFGR